MKKMRESRMVKAIMLILLLLFLAFVPLAVIGKVLIYDNILEMEEESWHEVKAYEDTEEFSYLYNRTVYQLVEYLKLKELLEEDGIFSYDKTVLWMHGEEDEAVGYTVGELIKESGFFAENVMPVGNSRTLGEIFAGTEGYYQIYEQAESGEIDVNFYRTEDFVLDFDLAQLLIFDNIDSAKTYYAEEWLPGYRNLSKYDNIRSELNYYAAVKDTNKLGKTIKEEAEIITEEAIDDNVHENSTAAAFAMDAGNPQINSIVDNAMDIALLGDVANRYTYYVAYYLYYDKLFTQGNSNFAFWVKYDDGTVDTNIEEEMLGTQPYEAFNASLIGEVRYATEGYTVQSDLAYTNRYYIDKLEQVLAKNDGGVELHLGVMSTMGAKDLFSYSMEKYELARKLNPVMTVVGISGILGALFCSVFLTAAAGHKRGVDGVALMPFDKWYTEISLFLCCAAGIIILLAANELMWMAAGWHEYFAYAAVAGIFLLEYVVLVFSAGSLIRRLKAGIIWKNSFFRAVCISFGRGLSKAYKIGRQLYWERKISSKIIVSYLFVFTCSTLLELFIFICLQNLYDTLMLIIFISAFILLAGLNLTAMYMIVKTGIETVKITEGAERIANGDLNYKLDMAVYNEGSKRLVRAVNNMSNGLAEAVEKSIKDERTKTDLITNVSHDIKTPLTSIINYVELLKRENIKDEKVQSYIEVLDSKSQRLKTLTEDLVEASKLSSGNVVLMIEKIDIVELVNQTNGEFMEKFSMKNLSIVAKLPDHPVFVEADGRRLWRVLENLYNNVAKYAMEKTRVYVSILHESGKAFFIIKNISENPLNIQSEELTERFIRGDISRSTEGSGLGLSIAKSLTELMKGSFAIYLDGDLFRVTLTFPVKEEV